MAWSLHKWVNGVGHERRQERFSGTRYEQRSIPRKSSPDALQLLKDDHARVKSMFGKFEVDAEHAGAKELIAKIQASGPSEQHFEARVTVLGEAIKHHVELGERMSKFKSENAKPK